MARQAVEDRMLTKAPSSTIVQSIILAVTHIDIWKATLNEDAIMLGYSS